MAHQDNALESAGAGPPSTSKRKLLRAGWVAPAVVVLSLPAVSFEANASGGGRNPPPCGRPAPPTGTPACEN
jgi:hypothetical protein